LSRRASLAARRIADRATAALSFPLDWLRYRALASAEPAGRRAALRDLQPCLRDRTATTTFDRHYVLHPAWALRVLTETRPAEHVDIGSILSFVAMASAIVPVRFYDYRPAPLRLPGLTSGQADLLRLPFPDRSLASLSCMHVVEHVGLGRYGDPIDPQGDRKAMAELERVLAPGGTLLFVTPVGQPRVRFNAHRIYDVATVLGAMPGLRLRSFALVPDPPATPPYDAALIEDADPAMVARQSYGCGCFRLERPA
jgi:SAM-dependent methyltransferase